MMNRTYGRSSKPDSFDKYHKMHKCCKGKIHEGWFCLCECHIHKQQRVKSVE